MSAVYGLYFLGALRARPVVVLDFLGLVKSRLVGFLFFLLERFFIYSLGCNNVSSAVWLGLCLAL